MSTTRDSTAPDEHDTELDATFPGLNVQIGDEFRVLLIDALGFVRRRHGPLPRARPALGVNQAGRDRAGRLGVFRPALGALLGPLARRTLRDRPWGGSSFCPERSVAWPGQQPVFSDRVI